MTHFILSKRCTWLIVMLCYQLSPVLFAQVTYDNNAATIGASPSAAFVQNTFTVPAGTDRLLVAFVMRDGVTTVSDSMTFNGQHLTMQLQQSGGAGLNGEIWYLVLGCGTAITEPLSAYFSHLGGGSLPDVIVEAATFQNVDQFVVFGGFQMQSGSGGSSNTLNISTSDTNGLLIGSASTDVSSGMITITPSATNQIEIFETSISGNNNSLQGSTKATTGGTDALSWLLLQLL